MIRSLLIRISSDPRKSPRPAEAVRIGAGVGAWNKSQSPSPPRRPRLSSASMNSPTNSKAANSSPQYLPSILHHGGRIMVDQSTPTLQSIKPAIPFEKLPAAEITAFTTSADHTMNF